MDLSNWQFNCGCRLSRESQAFVVAAVPGPEFSSQANNTSFFVYYNGNWFSYQKDLFGPAVAIASVKSPISSKWIVIASNPSGKLWVLYPKEREEIHSQIEGCVSVTNLKSISGRIYACGMGRTVFKLEDDGMWSNISVRRPNSKQGLVGFTDITGSQDELIYAVGWQGEIWTKAGDNEWSQEVSPTKSNLNAVTVADDGTAYIVGDNGVLVKGRKGKWELIETDEDLNFQDVCQFETEIYLSTDFDVFRLTSKGLVSSFSDLSDFKADHSISCLKLFVSEDGTKLYSVGPSNVFIYSDRKWELIA